MGFSEEGIIFNPSVEEELNTTKMTISLDPNKTDSILMMIMDGGISENKLNKHWKEIVNVIAKDYNTTCQSLFTS